MKSGKKLAPVKVGNIKVPIYYTPTNGRDRWTIAYYEAGKRVRRAFDDLNKAKSEAALAAGDIASGQGDALKLTAADRDSYVRAQRDLQPLGIPLHVAIAEFVAARKLLPEGVTLGNAVEDFAARHRGSAGDRSVTDVIAEFLADRKPEVSERHFADLRVQLAPLPAEPRARATRGKRMQPFADRFRCSIRAVTAADIESWLAAIGGEAKRWNNIRTSVVSLFRFARRKNYLPRDLQTEADMAKRKRVEESDPEILSPEEFAKLLAMEDEEARIYAMLGGLAGLRPEETLRMKWSNIHHETGVVEVTTQAGQKTGKRLVTMHPTLALWLAPYAGRKGAIFSRGKVENVFLKHARAVLDSWPENGLRHSYGSYRLADCQNLDRVALEMGNSPRMIEKHYKSIRTRDGRLVTDSLAKAWFSILPTAPANVIAKEFRAVG